MAGARGDVAFHRLGQSEHDLGTVPGRAQQQFIVGIGNIAGFEQNRRRPGAAEDVEIREAMRVGAKRDAARIGRDYLTGTRIEGLDLSDPRPVLSALAFNARGLVKKLAA